MSMSSVTRPKEREVDMCSPNTHLVTRQASTSAFWRPRWPVGPAQLHGIKAVGFGDSKTLLFAGNIKTPQNSTSAAMVLAGAWQKELRKSIKHKVQRPGRNFYRKGMFGVTSIPISRWDHQHLKLGPFGQIDPAVVGNWTSAWSGSNRGTNHCTTVIFKKLTYIYVNSWIADKSPHLNILFFITGSIASYTASRGKFLGRSRLSY